MKELHDVCMAFLVIADIIRPHYFVSIVGCFLLPARPPGFLD